MKNQTTQSSKDMKPNKASNTHENLEKQQLSDKINLDYDWNTEYGDGDIPDIDK